MGWRGLGLPKTFNSLHLTIYFIYLYIEDFKGGKEKSEASLWTQKQYLMCKKISPACFQLSLFSMSLNRFEHSLKLHFCGSLLLL